MRVQSHVELDSAVVTVSSEYSQYKGSLTKMEQNEVNFFCCKKKEQDLPENLASLNDYFSPLFWTSLVADHFVQFSSAHFPWE